MKKFIGLVFLIFIGAAGWRIGNNLSSDAISMALGVFFGVLAGIPAALLVLASDRQRPAGRANYAYGVEQERMQRRAPQSQPPVIVLNGGGNQPALAGPPRHHAGYDYHNYFNPQSDQPQFLYQQQPFAQMGGPQPERPARRFKVVGEEEAWIEEW